MTNKNKGVRPKRTRIKERKWNKGYSLVRNNNEKHRGRLEAKICLVLIFPIPILINKLGSDNEW